MTDTCKTEEARGSVATLLLTTCGVVGLVVSAFVLDGHYAKIVHSGLGCKVTSTLVSEELSKGATLSRLVLKAAMKCGDHEFALKRSQVIAADWAKLRVEINLSCTLYQPLLLGNIFPTDCKVAG